MEFELAAFGGWPEGGAETIKEAAVKLLEDKGWKATRVALGATIRYVKHWNQGSRCAECAG